MWSRFAEGIADIVAPEDHEHEEESEERVQKSLTTDVPPPRPSSPINPATALEMDEQEQYICELERALLQRKRQNDALEAKVVELETRARELEQLTDQVPAQVDNSQQETKRNSLPNIRQDDVEEKRSERSELEIDNDRLVHKLQQSQAETAAFATQCQAHEKELLVLRARIDELETAMETLREDELEARSRAAEYEQGYLNLLTEIETLKTANEVEKAVLTAKNDEHARSIDSQRVYDLEAQLLASEADKVVAQKDAERLQHNVNALESVLHQFQMDSKAQKEAVAAMEAELRQVKHELETRRATPASLESDLQRVMETLAKKTHECDQLREALESTAMQYMAERNVLDKSLAAQLVVAYIDSAKKGEVLQLMARMMDFTDDQKRRVGLSYPIEGNGGGGLFSSILGLVAPSETENSVVDPSAIEGKSFADMWSQFLLDEAAREK